jgi:O-antigen/teichoic acid export membrane protein
LSEIPKKSESRTRAYGRTAGFLTIGVGLTGIFTYAYFLIASHDLSKDSYGEITVLWSAVFITVSTLYRPVDQLLSRSISEHIERGETDVGPVRVAARIQTGLALAFAVLALVFKGPLQDGLLEGNTTLYWVFFSAVLFYAASYYARGYLAGHQQFGLFTTLILSESVFRTLFAALVAFGLLSGQSWVAMGIVAAPLLSLLVVPSAIHRRSRREAEERARAAEATGSGREDVEQQEKEAREEFSLSRGAGFVGSVFLIMFSEQVFLNAGPLVVSSVSGAAAAGFIFNVLMIARAPLQLFQAVSTSILPHLTALHHSKEEDSEQQFHHSVRMVLLGLAAFTAVTALTVIVAGPKLMQIAFSDKFTYDRLGLLLVTAGMGLYLAAVTVNQACLAQGQARRASIRWISCAAFFLLWTLLPFIGDANLRVEIGFALTALLLLSLLYVIYLRPRGIEEDVPVEGSSEAIEARLAGYEEGNL